MSDSPELKELREQNRLMKQQLGENAARLETLMQLIAAKSEPERLQLLEKQELAKKRNAVRDEAIKVALQALGKGAKPSQVTHVRYVTGSYYPRKGVLYPPGATLKIPVGEQPAEDWKPWRPARITKVVAIDPDAGIPYGDLRSSTSAIASIKRDEARAMADAVARGDVVITDTAPPANTVPDQGEMAEQQPAAEQGPESALTTRASDTDVG